MDQFNNYLESTIKSINLMDESTKTNMLNYFMTMANTMTRDDLLFAKNQNDSRIATYQQYQSILKSMIISAKNNRLIAQCKELLENNKVETVSEIDDTINETISKLENIDKKIDTILSFILSVNTILDVKINNIDPAVPHM